MEYSELAILFGVIVAALWLMLLIVVLYRSNTSVLRRKGLSDEYIQFIKSDVLKRSLGIALVVPLLLLLSSFIVWLVAGTLESPELLPYVVLVFTVLVIPFPILDVIKTNRKFKDLARATNTEVVFDFNYRILHLVFNPTLEMVTGIIYVLYFFVFVEWFHVAFLHLALMWFLYFSARSGNYLTRPLLKDGYIYLYAILAINQLILIYHLMNVVAHIYSCADCYEPTGIALGLLLGLSLLGKLIYYSIRLPSVRHMLSQ